MSKKIILSIAGFLLLLNVVCWQEVFVLAVPQSLEVNFLDVGQGDSIFIKTPENHQILIDGGPGSLLLTKLSRLMPFWDKTIDLVILTHPESDHMQGLLNILQSYKADYILWTGVHRDTPEYNKWINILERQKSLMGKVPTKILIAESGERIKAGNVILDTLFPLESLEGKDMKNTSNDSGVVEKLIYGKNSFLFTGDISSVAEKELVSNESDLESDVLKVAHHGSKYSTSDSFLSAVNSKIAVISVGNKNTYGHPTPEVLQRLEKSGIKVLRTDINGDIKMISNGNIIQIK